MHWASFLIALALSCPAAARSGDVVSIDRKDVPAPVSAQVECGTEPASITRRPFAGGFVFAWACASNHANWISALVFSVHADGAGARLLRFPAPRGEPFEELSNVRWDAAKRELSHLFIDPEQDICRSEGRWRLTGKETLPVLFFWRETRDCEGRKGWTIVVDKRRSN